MSGIEPEAFRMRSGRSTTELHPLRQMSVASLSSKWMYIEGPKVNAPGEARTHNPGISQVLSISTVR